MCPLAELCNVENLSEPEYFGLDIDPLMNTKELLWNIEF